MATPRPVTSERSLGYWAFGCSLLTTLSWATAQVTFRASFCGGGSGCEDLPDYTLLFWMAAIGYVVGVVTTGVLAVWALVQHRQPRWAVAALVIILAPYVPAVVDMWS
jgi:TRAP-type C4-dicarboxylate transport system permease small subunit